MLILILIAILTGSTAGALTALGASGGLGALLRGYAAGGRLALLLTPALAHCSRPGSVANFDAG